MPPPGGATTGADAPAGAMAGWAAAVAAEGAGVAAEGAAVAAGMAGMTGMAGMAAAIAASATTAAADAMGCSFGVGGASSRRVHWVLRLPAFVSRLAMGPIMPP